MSEVSRINKKWVIAGLIVLLLLSAAYFLFTPAPEVIPAATLPIIDTNTTAPHDTAASPLRDTVTQPDTTTAVPQLKDTISVVEKKEVAKKETGSLRLKSAQGFWFDYTGEIVNGEAHGKGVAIFENGNRYEGNFSHNKRSGFGKAINKNGDGYQGQWKNDRFNGKGTYTWKNGDRFEGYFKDAQRNGKGKLYDKQGELLKEGIWKDDELMKK
ncbi:MAG TPA: hypothetical protein VK202_10900 [Bacteroidia bacterium]|nr:hypothetical protein [Bacteroidia bacterium]